MKILIWPASLREKSLNKRLARLIDGRLKEKGIETDLIDFSKFEMPLFDNDHLELNGIPKSTVYLSKKILINDALVIVSPEYNYGVPGPLKNAIDWLSRVRPYPTTDKICFLASASPSLSGGVKGLISLRPILSFMKAWVVPEMFSLAKADTAFESDKKLVNNELDEMLHKSLERLILATTSLKLE